MVGIAFALIYPNSTHCPTTGFAAGTDTEKYTLKNWVCWEDHFCRRGIMHRKAEMDWKMVAYST